LDQVHAKIQYGLQHSLCPQGVCKNGRKRKVFKILKFLWWISFIYSERWNGDGGVQFGKELQNGKSEMIFSLFQGLLLPPLFWST
jgi:hypothetical protein